MVSKRTTIINKEQMKASAAAFLDSLEHSDKATVVGLRGDLGAGKTTFSQICAGLLGIKETVTSPTFVILKRYEIDPRFLDGKFSNFIHIDAYRLKGGNELSAIGWQEIISDPKNLIFIEWPELVADAMPENTIYIDLKHIDETTREITV